MSSGVAVGLRLALLHHPLCHRFEEDAVRLGPLRVCSGCAMAAPGLVVGLVLAVHVSPPLLLVALGGLLGVPHLLTYLRRHGRGARLAAKAIGGAGLGLLIVGGLRLGLPWAVTLAALAVLALAFLALQALRLVQMRRRCHACPWRADWARCPGFTGDEAAVRATRAWEQGPV